MWPGHGALVPSCQPAFLLRRGQGPLLSGQSSHERPPNLGSPASTTCAGEGWREAGLSQGRSWATIPSHSRGPCDPTGSSGAWITSSVVLNLHTGLRVWALTWCSWWFSR